MGEKGGEGRKGEVREGKGKGWKDRAPKLLLNQGPSEPCYATDRSHDNGADNRRNDKSL